MEAHETHARDELIFNLFLAAVSCPPEQRESFLDEACLNDTALREEVSRRIYWESRLKGFLLTPVLPCAQLDRPFAPGDTILRRFQILRIAGEGGMGIVYEAVDEKLNRRIALKCPRFEFRRRLSPEALNSLRVTHSNVCRVFEIHTAETNSGEVEFLTMEFLDGQTLAARLSSAPANWLNSVDGVAVAQQICAGLKAIHGEGVIHRDLKPNNVMLSTDSAERPRAVIMDFGIANGGDLFSSLKRGSPDYIAPELWKGLPASPQSDIYALGVILHEMACGKKPFPDTVSWKERLSALPPLTEVREPALRVIRRCLDPDPRRRFADAAEVGAALEPGISRRFWIGGIAALSVAGASGYAAISHFLPTSPVRLAILQVAHTAAADDTVLRGYTSDTWYRLKTARHTRRPLVVFGPDEAAADNMSTLSAAGQFGATHALTTDLRHGSQGWSISAELVDLQTSKTLRKLDRSANDLVPLLFSFQSEVVRTINQELRLQFEAKAQTLPQSAFSDYLQGLNFVRFDYERAAEAIPIFEKVIAMAPQSAQGYAGLAEALLRKLYESGDNSLESRALQAITKAEQLDPDLAYVHLMAGRLAALRGFYQRGIAECQRAVELDPHDADAYIRMATYLFLDKRPQESEAAFQAAFAAQPGYYKPYLDIGLLYFEVHDFKTAERYWLEAVRLAPGQTRARLNLGALYQRTGRLAEARSSALESLNIRRTSAALELLADLQRHDGQFAEAAASMEEAIRIGPPDYTTWSSMASVYQALHRESDASTALRRGLEWMQSKVAVRPNDPELVAWCAYYHARLGEFVQAKSRADEARSLNSPQGTVRRRLVLTYGLIHDIEAALRLLQGAKRDLIQELFNSPDLPDALRSDPRFKQLTE